MSRHRALPPFAAILLTVALAAAPTTAQDLGYRGWGPRLGAGDDPDQVLLGGHVDLGTFVRDLRFQPSLEIGFGDRHTIFSATLPVHWIFRVDGEITPYAGGGLIASFIDRDRPRHGQDGREFDLAPMAAGGIEWQHPVASIFLELNLAGGDTHSARLWLGVTFR
jgi:hypothetical protein